MNIAIDVVIIITVIITVMICTLRGFIKSIFGFGKLYVSITLANIYDELLGGYLLKAPIGLKIKSFLYAKLSFFSETVDENIVLGISDAICNVIGFCIVFIMSFIVLGVLSVILNRFFELKPLKSINTVAGFCLGVVIAIVNAFIVIIIIEFIFNMGLVKSSEEIKESTIIYKFICDMDVFSFIAQYIK